MSTMVLEKLQMAVLSNNVIFSPGLCKWGTKHSAHFICLPYLTPLIQIINSSGENSMSACFSNGRLHISTTIINHCWRPSQFEGSLDGSFPFASFIQLILKDESSWIYVYFNPMMTVGQEHLWHSHAHFLDCLIQAFNAEKDSSL